MLHAAWPPWGEWIQKCCAQLKSGLAPSTLTKINPSLIVKTFRRNRFFAGRLLTAADLEREQNYFRNKLKLHNSFLHGFGIVTGLEVSGSSSELHITSGLAIDCEGNEIVVEQGIIYPLPATSIDTAVFLTIHYREQMIDLKPTIASEPCREATVVEEVFGLKFESQNPNENHRHARGRWQPCGTSHGLVLARLRQCSGKWRIDRRLRRPVIK